MFTVSAALTASSVTGNAGFRNTMPSFVISGAGGNSFADLYSTMAVNGAGIPICCIGTATDDGGIYYCSKFSLDVDPLSASAFIGLAQPLPGGTTTPQTRPNHIGMSFEATDLNTNSQWYVSYRAATTETKYRFALTASSASVLSTLQRGSQQVIIFEILIPPGASPNIYMRIRTQEGARSFTEIYNANIPNTASFPTAGIGLLCENYIRGGTPAIRIYGIKGAYGGGFMI